MSETEFDAEAVARHYARAFLTTDPSTKQVIYLPAGAGERDVRLLVVSDAIVARELAPLEPVDFGVGRGERDAHTLHIVDVTPDQWVRVRAGGLPLPAGWSLHGSVPHAPRRARS